MGAGMSNRWRSSSDRWYLHEGAWQLNAVFLGSWWQAQALYRKESKTSNFHETPEEAKRAAEGLALRFAEQLEADAAALRGLLHK